MLPRLSLLSLIDFALTISPPAIFAGSPFPLSPFLPVHHFPSTRKSAACKMPVSTCQGGHLIQENSATLPGNGRTVPRVRRQRMNPGRRVSHCGAREASEGKCLPLRWRLTCLVRGPMRKRPAELLRASGRELCSPPVDLNRRLGNELTDRAVVLRMRRRVGIGATTSGRRVLGYFHKVSRTTRLGLWGFGKERTSR